MSWLSIVADVLGIIGSVFSFVTFVLAINFKRKMVHMSDQRAFRTNVKRTLEELKSRTLTLKQEKMFTKYLIEDIETLTNDIYNNYYNILSVSKSSINNLRRSMDSYYAAAKSNNEDLIEEKRRDCLTKIEKLCADLRRDSDSI